jgi:GT2 family glycosyltransferase
VVIVRYLLASSGENPVIDVVTVTLLWRSEASPPRALVPLSTSSISVRSLIVCNSSRGTPEEFELLEDGSALLWSGGNLGYGGGNNFAVAWARRTWSPRYFLILNPDVDIEWSAIERLVAHADRDQRIAISGPVQELESVHGSRLRRGLRYFRSLSILKSVDHAGVRIDYINGGALLLRAAAFDDQPPFTDKYFLFFEELELCERIKGLGYRIEICEDSRVIHREGGVRGSRRDADYCPEIAEYFENLNALRFTREYYPWWLPSVLIVRFFLKPIVLLSRGEFVRLTFWRMAIHDFFRRRVSRFSFQAGWSPELNKESLHERIWPIQQGERQ